MIFFTFPAASLLVRQFYACGLTHPPSGWLDSPRYMVSRHCRLSQGISSADQLPKYWGRVLFLAYLANLSCENGHERANPVLGTSPGAAPMFYPPSGKVTTACQDEILVSAEHLLHCTCLRGIGQAHPTEPAYPRRRGPSPTHHVDTVLSRNPT